MAAPVQWVAFWDGPAKVKATTRLGNLGSQRRDARGPRLVPPQGGDAFGVVAIEALDTASTWPAYLARKSLMNVVRNQQSAGSW